MWISKNLSRVLVATVIWLGVGMAPAQDNGTPIPPAKIEGLRTALSSYKDESSAARKRLAVKRMIRDAGELFEASPDAPNRFEILGLIFTAQQQLFGLEDSSRNREALLETSKQLATAPDVYAELRLDADLLLTQTELARKGGDAEARLAALSPLIDRYRNTPAEAKMLRVAMVMALEIGDPRLIASLREEMAERYAGDLEMINFQQEKLGGQVFGAPFCGTFKRSDGAIMQLPGDGLGHSNLLYFWTTGEAGKGDFEALVAEWKKQRRELSGLLSIVSLNVDELPDAGEKILRDHGVEWPALHLPGGRENPLYKTFAKSDSALVTLTPTGYAALVMSGSTRTREGDSGPRDFERWFQSALARDWSRPRYAQQLTSLFIGEFLIVDPEGPLDPTFPPEIKALVGPGLKNPEPLKRLENSVPVETLESIQDCFPLPPFRYRMPVAEVRAGYERAEDLCAKAISAHPNAPDLWIVRNRRMIAQLGLWKFTSDHSHYQRAIEEAKAALDGEMPSGTEVVARFCLAKEALRAPEAEPQKVIGDFVEAFGGAKASGPALAAAALLALDVADRGLHEDYRDLILEHHLDHPMMWTFGAFLLDRYHRYWLFRVPFTAGWSYGRRQNYFFGLGNPEEVSRRIEAGFRTLEGKDYRLPEDSKGKWTAVVITGAWEDPKKSPVHGMVTRYLAPYAEKRGLDDFEVVVIVVDDDLSRVQANLAENPLDCPTIVIPATGSHPLLMQFGIVDEDERPNVIVLGPDGSVAVVLSGLTMSRVKGAVVPDVIDWHDEQAVKTLLEQGDLEKAKELIFKLAPPFDPNAVDEKGRKLKQPQFGLSHLRARARVYFALKDLDAALLDAEEVVKRQTAIDGGMSLRTGELEEAEKLRDTIRVARDGEKQ